MGQANLPLASGRRHRKAFKRLGFHQVRMEGDHAILRHADGRIGVLPMHREVKRTTLATLLAQLDVPEVDYCRAFR